ncbi:histidine phosphatase family protein [Corynebacterium sanguinis]|uniref:histidine phosphatase family protein n=1 Tax=Corynebacterium sanguinis TaxID=2594913 RepID=UPI0021A8BC89|nr:histidine phosphatase family protein [Corynebacterium sanguinis]MCT1491632.1 histidine phosphatase family protein [Corynebacterium sanguinis]MCT2247834.1 histidine phosphatase family protein [Corynebacterium sanguinis]
MRRRLILLRHGQTHYNAGRRMQGQLDTELSEVGVEQARAAAQLMKNLGVSKIVSSDLTRARHTAEIIAASLGLELTHDARLRETHLGQWQGKTHAEVDSERGRIRAHWRNNAAWAPPAGESRLDVAKRARPVVDELMSTYSEWDDSAVLLVAHGGTISALTSNLLGLRESQYPLFNSLKNTNTSRLSAEPAYREGEALPAEFPTEPSAVKWYLDAWNQGFSD